MSDGDFDLFGDPVRLPGGRRGRPAHIATQENRNKTIMLVAMGWSNERIAAALHVSQPTLRRYYFSELNARLVQRDRLDAQRLMVVWKAADAGNVGAMRLFNQMVEKNDLMITEAQLRARGIDKNAPKPGKKQVNQEASASAEERIKARVTEEANSARQH
ncbi:hypothetical protein [Sulfitobacter sp.]|uniref:hypothetical protein n=1 Tax=Sulfitobacter sp. TaxID=1903071 RepID=UPI0030014FBD